MSDLIDTTEMYLRTIYELGEEGIPPLRARIAERLKQGGPTVTQTVAGGERDGRLPGRELSPGWKGRCAHVRRRGCERWARGQRYGGRLRRRW